MRLFLLSGRLIARFCDGLHRLTVSMTTMVIIVARPTVSCCVRRAHAPQTPLVSATVAEWEQIATKCSG
eukprot:5248912-Prymnesium_polylepis.3